MILNILLLVLLLGIIIFVHEFGHFIFAKKFKIYVHEFALGMGPKIYSFKRKNDETMYSIRAFPIGGFVKLAGEDIDSEDDKKIKKDRLLINKSAMERFIVISAGAIFNFLLAIVLLFATGLIFGVTEERPYIGELTKEYSAYQEGMRNGDLILKVNDKKVSDWDRINLEFNMIEFGSDVTIEYINADGKIKEITLRPTIEDNTALYGISPPTKISRNFFTVISYTFRKFISLFKLMYFVIINLITGGLSMNAVSGPIGLYSVMGSVHSVSSFSYLLALLCVNVGFVNLIPFPAFDGGRLLFIVIEKIKGSPVNPKVEGIIHNVGFFILMGLMLYITIFDIIKLF